MAWDDEPPKKEELNSSWDAEPPKPEELEDSFLTKAAKVGKSAVGSAVDMAIPVLEAIDSVTGAPTRSAADALISGENPISAFGQQFAADPSKAPTGEDLMEKLGVPESMSIEPQPGIGEVVGEDKLPKINPRAILGVGADMALDPLNIVPGKAISKVVGKGVSKIGHGLAKIGEGLTGVPTNDIKVFAKRADQIDALAKSNDKNISLAVDSVREDLMENIYEAKNVSNAIISHVLKNSKNKVSIVRPMQALKDFKETLNPKLHKKQIQEVKELEKLVRGMAKDGKMSVQDAFDLTKELQKRAQEAYTTAGKIYGAISTETAIGARNAAGNLRAALREVEPSISREMGTHSALHEIEDRVLKLVGEGKPDAGLLAAGSGSNVRNRNLLKGLSKITRKDMVTPAENLSAMRYFSEAPLLPVDTTGKSLSRMAVGGAIGTLLSRGNEGEGAVMGAALTSPFLLKQMIRAGRGGAKVANKIGAVAKPVVANNLGRGIGREAAIMADNSIEGYPEMATQQIDPSMKSAIEQEISADPALNIVERARQLRLLRKYNRMVIPPQSY